MTKARDAIQKDPHGQVIRKIGKDYFVEKSIVEPGMWALYERATNKFITYCNKISEARNVAEFHAMKKRN